MANEEVRDDLSIFVFCCQMPSPRRTRLKRKDKAPQGWFVPSAATQENWHPRLGSPLRESGYAPYSDRLADVPGRPFGGNSEINDAAADRPLEGSCARIIEQ